jgi:hypothetical protein
LNLQEEVTVLRPGPDSRDAGGISSSLPADLMDQVRGRVRLLALLLLAAFLFDPLLYGVTWVLASLTGHPLQSDVFARLGFITMNMGAALASVALGWAAGNRSVSASRLHTLGLVYEVVICFIIALATFWQYYIDKGILPNLTWVPAVVILFPLILPGPPRRMFAAALLASAMSPLSLMLLHLSGTVSADGEAYVEAVVSSAFAVAFASIGARVVYRLGREVATAREMGSYVLEE